MASTFYCYGPFVFCTTLMVSLIFGLLCASQDLLTSYELISVLICVLFSPVMVLRGPSSHSSSEPEMEFSSMKYFLCFVCGCAPAPPSSALPLDFMLFGVLGCLFYICSFLIFSILWHSLSSLCGIGLVESFCGELRAAGAPSSCSFSSLSYVAISVAHLLRPMAFFFCCVEACLLTFAILNSFAFAIGPPLYISNGSRLW